MKTREQIIAEAMAKAEKEIAEVETKRAILESLPVVPERIFIYSLYQSVGSVTYVAKTKTDALVIAQQFNILPAYICRNNGTVSLKCFDDAAAKEVNEIHAWLSVDQHKTELCFFTTTSVGIVRVEIELSTSLFGRYVRSDRNARIHFRMNWEPLPKTLEMFCAVNYAPAYREGPQSGGQKIYAIYDQYELINQFGG